MAIADYIARDNPAAAFVMHDTVLRQVGQLDAYPRLGRVGRVKGTREFVITGTPYIVAYRVTAKKVVILRVLHGARRWPDRP